MCYAKVDGGYRCMPPKSLLDAYRGTDDDVYDAYQPSTPSGAFWINSSVSVPHLEEIKQEAYGLRIGLANVRLDAAEFELRAAKPQLVVGKFITLDAAQYRENVAQYEKLVAEYEHEVAHLGNMIALYSDAKVEDFDRRLHDAQSLHFSYRASLLDPQMSRLDSIKLRKKVINANLSLGYEVRSNLRDTLQQIVAFNRPFDIKIEGDPQFASMLYSASKFFPSTWNQTLESNLKLDFVSQGDASWYKRRSNSMQITEGGENFSSYPSMEAARTASISNKRKYETQVEMVHELSHKFESVELRIAKVGNSFLKRRALLNQGYDFNGDRYERDHFANFYIGRNYNSQIHTEIFSMGMESTLLGTNGSLIGLALPASDKPTSQVFLRRADIEHRNLTLGTLAGIIPSFNQDTMGRPIKTVFADDPNDTFSILNLK